MLITGLRQVGLTRSAPDNRDYADLWRLTGGHNLDGTACTQALQRTAAYRGIGLQVLSAAIGSLGTTREASWRAKQGPAAHVYPQRFTDLIVAVIDFADPVLAGQVHRQRWNAQQRTWSGIQTDQPRSE